MFIFICGSSAKVSCAHFLLIKSNGETHRNKHKKESWKIVAAYFSGSGPPEETLNYRSLKNGHATPSGGGKK